jgi:transcriptional regulator with PAS, ATPase and Fis domain
LPRHDRQALHDYDWPGNVRQLRQVLRRAILLEMPVNAAMAEEADLEAMTVTQSEEADGILSRSLDDVRPIKEIRRLYAQRV